MASTQKRVVFIVGGARSGKSRFALAEASKLPGRAAFIATATPSDEEMKQRIDRHKEDRDARWETFETPVDIAPLLEEMGDAFNVVVIDCLTLWLSNLMFSGKEIEEEFRSFVLAVSQSPSNVFIVSNEVGQGIVPENAMARQFRDLSGFLNQRVAEQADDVYLMSSGIALKIK